MGFEGFDFYETLSIYRRRYIFALCAVALLAVSTFIGNYNVIQGQSDDGVRINIAGRQRMLSQRMAFFATMSQQSTSPARRAMLDAEMTQMRQLFERSHRALLEGDTGLELERKPQEASFYELYFGEPALDSHVENYLKDVDAIIALPDDRVVPLALTRRVQTNAIALLPILDRATRWEEAQSAKNVQSLLWLEVIILCAMLGVLGLEAVLIFKPMTHILEDQLDTIRTDGVAIELAARRMKILLDATGDGVVTLTGDGRFGELYNQQLEAWFGDVVEGEDAIDVLFEQEHAYPHIRDLFMVHGKLNHLIALAANMPDRFEAGGKTFSLRTHYTYEPEPRLILILRDQTSIKNVSDAHDTLAAKEQLFSSMLQAMRYPLSAIEDQAKQIYDDTEQEENRQCAANIMVLASQVLLSTDDPIQLSDMKGGHLVFAPSVFVLEELIAEVIHALSSATSLQHNTVQTMLEPGLSAVYTDRVKVFHLLTNILSSFNMFIDHGVLRIIMRTQHKQVQKQLMCELICLNRRSYSRPKKTRERDAVWHKFFGEDADDSSELPPEIMLTRTLCDAIGAELFERRDDPETVCYRLVIPINSSAATLDVEKSGQYQCVREWGNRA